MDSLWQARETSAATRLVEKRARALLRRRSSNCFVFSSVGTASRRRHVTRLSQETFLSKADVIKRTFWQVRERRGSRSRDFRTDKTETGLTLVVLQRKQNRFK